MEAPEEAVRKSGERRRGRGSRLALLVLSRDPRHSRPSSELQLLAAALRLCQVSAETKQQIELVFLLLSAGSKEQELTHLCGWVDAVRERCIERTIPAADRSRGLLPPDHIVRDIERKDSAHLARTWSRSAEDPARHGNLSGHTGPKT